MLPLLLAPARERPRAPLFGARLVALGWTLAGALAVYLLVRPQAAAASLALAACALWRSRSLDLTFWHMLVRPDGPMLALLAARRRAAAAARSLAAPTGCRVRRLAARHGAA